jgi:hypothetical protein
MSYNMDLVDKWYDRFHHRDLDWVVGSFADDAIVIVGDGDSEGAVPYGGRFVGIEQIKHYYAGRFMKTGGAFDIIRPFCGVTAPTVKQEFGRWVIIGSTIEDTLIDQSPIYRGNFLHVWSINPGGGIASLSMYFDKIVT